MKTRILFACAPGVLALFAISCSSPDFCVGAACGTVDGGDDEGGVIDGGEDGPSDATVLDGGTDADAMAQGDTAPPACNTSADVSSQAACISDGFAIFVDGNNGNDSGSGTQESPFKSITNAVKAAGAKSSIFICASNYGETVTITSPVSLYGGFGCASHVWTYTAAKTTVGTTGSVGATALTVNGTSTPITVEDLDFEGADQTALPGGTSVGAVVLNATALVSLNRVTLRAGGGGAGAGGTLQSVMYPSATALQGNDGMAGVGGLAVTVACPAGGTTIGAEGGANGFGGANGLPALGDGGTGGIAAACSGAGSGSDGLPATPPSSGSGAATRGTLSIAGWSSTKGSDGVAGGPGQGGGGGFGQGGGGGGSGGAGGCGGAGGLGGQGGGSSFALAAFMSKVVVTKSILIAAAAGAGGGGSAGQPGEAPGGVGGTRQSGTTACNGGNGGAGAAGAAGGGGAGGDSATVVYLGSSPMLDSATTAAAVAGALGPAGKGGVLGGNDGVAGITSTAPIMP